MPCSLSPFGSGGAPPLSSFAEQGAIRHAAANAYLELKNSLTFAASIPAAAISIAGLRYLPGATIIGNIQTVASATASIAGG